MSSGLRPFSAESRARDAVEKAVLGSGCRPVRRRAKSDQACCQETRQCEGRVRFSRPMTLVTRSASWAGVLAVSRERVWTGVQRPSGAKTRKWPGFSGLGRTRRVGSRETRAFSRVVACGLMLLRGLDCFLRRRGLRGFGALDLQLGLALLSFRGAGRARLTGGRSG